MLSERSFIDKIEILETHHIQLRRADVVLRDGQEIARTFHRRVLRPGDDLSTEDPRIRRIAEAAWSDLPTVHASEEDEVAYAIA